MTYRLLTEVRDLPDGFDAVIGDCLEWFDGEPLRTVDFIDRLCHDYGSEWDIESYDNPAVREIMRRARQMRKDAA